MSIPTKHPLASLEYTQRVAKRAQYEAFEFTLVPDGIRVRNGSYADPGNHEYLVTVADGVPTDCTCPANAHYEGACKHRVAVAIRRPLVDAVMVDTELAADGGPLARPRLSGVIGDGPSVAERVTRSRRDCGLGSPSVSRCRRS